MTSRIRIWWRARTPREHRLLIVLALIAVPMLFWYGAVRPLDRALDRTQQARDADARALADVLLMAGKIRGSVRPARHPGPLDGLVQAEAERAGFTVSSLVRDGDGAVLAIDAVRPQPFFAWIAAMKPRHGLIVTRLTARANADATLSASVRFQRAR